MNKIEIEIGEELGRFRSHSEWVNHAPSTYKRAYEKVGGKDVITLDSAIPRRVMLRGLQFSTALNEQTFPVIIYAISSTV